MRVPGGEKAPQSLREHVLAQIQYGEEDPRASSAYCDVDEHGAPNKKPGFFSTGYYSAINWEQVCRQQQLSAWNAAAVTPHPRALWNDASGKPSDASMDGIKFLGDTGQLVYYVQAADVPVERALRGRKDLILQACNVPQMTQTGGLMSVLLLFLGMRVKLTKKIMPPELVQEASGEIVRIAFHDDESFGHTRPRGQRLLCPPKSHPCWQVGWVLCDRLPTYVAVRFDKLSEDYTGLNQPGVWHVEPVSDDWDLRYKSGYCVQHPPGTYEEALPEVHLCENDAASDTAST